MSPHALAEAASAIDLNHPGHYLSWSIFDISVANLVVIAVMVVIFGLALLIPFPQRHAARPAAGTGTMAGDPTAGDAAESLPAADDPDADMWTNKVRRFAVRVLPPGKLLPDRQPAYVASWIYVFGVATLATLGLAIATGFALALGGPDWYHYNSVGHFFNSMHLWSVELFMAFMVIHLWGKFWMAAWRGRRALTWITGVVAFMASVVECFTGYLSQTNFDSQWIATNGKDAFNAVGVGAFFNVMNFGQMLMWHIVLLPIILVTIVGAHVLMVRVRGVSHPMPAHRVSWRDRAGRKAAAAADAAPWRGATRRYDILKEGTVAVVIATALVLFMAGLLSSPDLPPLSVQTWAKASAADFVGTAAAELDGTALAASYGPPYNNGSAAVQQVGPVNWQKLSGVTQPFNAAHHLRDLAAVAAGGDHAGPARRAQHLHQRIAGAAAVLGHRLRQGHGERQGSLQQWQPGGARGRTGAGDDGLRAEDGTGGTLDADLLAQTKFFGTNYTKPLLFIADGGYYANLATTLHLTGGQWGVMNETGSYPGQPWLWLYQMWYHVAPFSNSSSVDIWAVYMTGLATILLLLIPFIPGLRDIPRLIPVHRLIWRGNWSPGGPPAAAAAKEVPAAPQTVPDSESKATP